MTLSVPTIYLVIALNLLAIGIVWGFVARCYPKFPAAGIWTIACLLGATGAGVSLLRGSVSPLVPIVAGNMLLMLMSWFTWFGVRVYYGRSAPWLVGVVATVAVAVVLVVFSHWYDLMRLRIVVFSIGQSIPILLVLLEIARHRSQNRYGADLAVGAMSVILLLYIARSLAAITHFGGDLTLREFNNVQGAIMVMLVFTVMIGNFALLLMTVDRLRDDVATLALSDDLTGVANRRHLFQRLADECLRSHRTLQPFAVMVLDLDEFKSINDSHGHGAGDECLRAFTRTVQGRLRATDLLARIGGDEFCVLLPGVTQEEALAVARDLDVTLRRGCVMWNGVSIMLAASIGVAQWMSDGNDTPERLMAAADRALYDVKREGKERSALGHDLVMASLQPIHGDATASRHDGAARLRSA